MFTRLICLVLVCLFGSRAFGQSKLHSELASRGLSTLSREARILGDPERGIRVFHQQSLACAQCHSLTKPQALVGPDLSRLGIRATFEHVITSLLDPSSQIEPEYRAQTLVLTSGKVLTGLVRDETETSLTLHPSVGEPVVIEAADVEDRVTAPSLMPSGLVNQLSSSQDFFDLVSFLVLYGAKGKAALEQLAGDLTEFLPPPLPDYESNLDHAALVSVPLDEQVRRGQAIFTLHCLNCHGTIDAEGSLPNALRFATGVFKQGSDPYKLYQTLTHGSGMMMPQRQLVPRQKYDVIAYIREEILKKHNPAQYASMDDEYVQGLPKGSKLGPDIAQSQPWEVADYGPFLINTYEIASQQSPPRPIVTKQERQLARQQERAPREVWPESANFAFKGIALQLDDAPGGVAHAGHWLAFEHDTLRMAGIWSGQGFIDWQGILFNGRHGVVPRTVGEVHLQTPDGPAWAHPLTGSFDDSRAVDADGRRHGPLPREWGRYEGLYQSEQHMVVAYRVGQSRVLESFTGLLNRADGEKLRVVRTLNIGPTAQRLQLRVCRTADSDVLLDRSSQASLTQSEGYHLLTIPESSQPVTLQLLITPVSAPLLTGELEQLVWPEADLSKLTTGGPSRWPERLRTAILPDRSERPFALDTISLPIDNPWQVQLRLTGLDFDPSGQNLYICTADGDVWLVSDLNGREATWKRIGSGLFQPLGLKVHDGKLFVTCRDQIVILHDLNGDLETDYYENFNSDHEVTQHFHEFAMGLQVDAEGNFYYAKSACHDRDAIVPQHGTVLKVSADGRQTTTLAHGLRAANGVCLNPDGSLFVTDQQGHWTPTNRINHVRPDSN